MKWCKWSVNGMLQMTLGLLKLGFLTDYLSEPLTRAFTMSAAVHVATSQIRHIFGVSMGRFSGMLKLIYVCYRSHAMTRDLLSVLVCLGPIQWSNWWLLYVIIYVIIILLWQLVSFEMTFTCNLNLPSFIALIILSLYFIHILLLYSVIEYRLIVTRN